MLKSIYIKDFAIIDELRIDFSSGFNVFTGETGAGKSIIVGALSFLKGGRSDVSYIRKGAAKAVIEGVFELDERICSILDENEIEYDDELIVYRTFNSESKNTIRVNNRSVSLSFLSNLLNESIDIHSQKDSQYLLNQHNHLKLLDQYMNQKELIDEVNSLFHIYSKIKKEYNEYLESNDSQNDIDYYRYQIKEIDDAGLFEGEFEELEAKSKMAKDAAKYLKHLNTAYELYSMQGGIDERLYEAIKELDIDNSEINDIQKHLKEKYYEIDEMFSNISKLIKSSDISEDEINRVEERLYTINRLKRKYRKDVKEILEMRNELNRRIEAFENRTEYIKEYEKAISKAYTRFLDKASILSEKRKKAALELSKSIVGEAKGLELKYFDFKVVFNTIEASANGIDDIEFVLCTNKGEDYKSLIKTASGGEISRILLALKSIFTKISSVKLAVFDEIDTGVSGKAAFAIGMKMAKISKYTQVLSITHLSQVAAFGDAHYYVSKKEDGDRTSSDITLLNDEERIRQLSLISSSSTSESALNAANELYEKAMEIKMKL